MTAPFIMPIGFIDRTTDDGAIMMLTNPSDSHDLKLETPVTILRSTPDGQSEARARGRITGVGYTTAIISVVESQFDLNWPADQDIFIKDTPVYLALPGTFNPDPSKTVTREHLDSLKKLARRYRELTRPGRMNHPKQQMQDRNDSPRTDSSGNQNPS